MNSVQKKCSQSANDFQNIFGHLYFFFQMDDEDSILPHKLQTALEYVLEKRKELASDRADLPTGILSVSGFFLDEHKPAVANNVCFMTNF